MKLYIFFIFVFASIALQSQDTLVFNNGDEVAVKVREVGIYEIKYFKLDNLTGPIYAISKNDIFAIKYKNGSVEVFKENKNLNIKPTVSALEGMSKEERYIKGRIDAKNYYKGNGTFWGTGAATFLFLPVGVVVGAATALIPPKEYNLNAPDPLLLKDNQYHLGYKRQAHGKKAMKSLGGFGIGLCALVALNLIIGPQ